MRTEVTEAVKEAKEKESEATKLARATKTLEAQLIEAKKKADEALMENTVTGRGFESSNTRWRPA